MGVLLLLAVIFGLLAWRRLVTIDRCSGADLCKLRYGAVPRM
jgi:hypothetical protein